MKTIFHTTLTINSDQHTLDNLVYRLGRRDPEARNHWEEDELVFSLWNIVRPPSSELDNYYAPSFDHPYNWFQWNLKNWGTKWDCGNNRLLNYAPDGFVVYEFDTIWAGPLIGLTRLAQIFPEASMMAMSQSDKGESYVASWKDGVANGFSKI